MSETLPVITKKRLAEEQPEENAKKRKPENNQKIENITMPCRFNVYSPARLPAGNSAR